MGTGALGDIRTHRTNIQSALHFRAHSAGRPKIVKSRCLWNL
jgi:hypothetical protein